MDVNRRYGVCCCVVLALCMTPVFGVSTLFLDADSVGTGRLLMSQPLVTGFGAISFIGEIRDRDSDMEFTAAGALGNVFDIADSTQTAQLSFGFDVASIRFIYGGNMGDFSIQARNAAGAVVDSFYQASTDAGQPAGPITLSGSGIRSLFWRDSQGVFAPIDNVSITVPEPVSGILLGLGGLLLSRKNKR